MARSMDLTRTSQPLRLALAVLGHAVQDARVGRAVGVVVQVHHDRDHYDDEEQRPEGAEEGQLGLPRLHLELEEQQHRHAQQRAERCGELDRVCLIDHVRARLREVARAAVRRVALGDAEQRRELGRGDQEGSGGGEACDDRLGNQVDEEAQIGHAQDELPEALRKYASTGARVQEEPSSRGVEESMH